MNKYPYVNRVLQNNLSTYIKIDFYPFFRFSRFRLNIFFEGRVDFRKNGGWIPTLNMLFISWTALALVGPCTLKMSLFWQHRILLYLKCCVRFKYVMHHLVQFWKIKGCRVPTLNILIISVNLSSSNWCIYTKDFSLQTTEESALFDLWWKVKVFHAPLCLIFG